MRRFRIKADAVLRARDIDDAYEQLADYFHNRKSINKNSLFDAGGIEIVPEIGGHLSLEQEARTVSTSSTSTGDDAPIPFNLYSGGTPAPALADDRLPFKADDPVAVILEQWDKYRQKLPEDYQHSVYSFTHWFIYWSGQVKPLEKTEAQDFLDEALEHWEDLQKRLLHLKECL